MTRIIAGSAQRVNLKVPPSGTRPTSDKVREAIFNTLQVQGALNDADVLDLYAGSGALGLEAISRGAKSVELVDNANPAILALKTNQAAVTKSLTANQRGGSVGSGPLIRVVKQNVDSYLEQFYQVPAGPPDNPVNVGKPGFSPNWHLAFLDPPYDLPTAQLERVLNRLHPLLDGDAWVVIERSVRGEKPTADLALWEVVKEKTYGETWVGYWRPALPTPNLDSSNQLVRSFQ